MMTRFGDKEPAEYGYLCFTCTLASLNTYLYFSQAFGTLFYTIFMCRTSHFYITQYFMEVRMPQPV